MENIEKKFHCGICNGDFKAKRSLKDHLMIHEGLKPLNCPFSGCSKTFIQFSCLQKHQRTHNQEKPYICEKCKRAFSQISNLNKHKKIHSNEKPFVCKSCGRLFRVSFHLKQHMQTHKNKVTRRKYLCQQCNRNFINYNTLKMHLKLKHDMNPTNNYNMLNFGENPILFQHKNHLDVLKNGFLYPYDLETKSIKLSGHILEESEDNKTVCEPFDEFSHIRSYKELSSIYNEICNKKSGEFTIGMFLTLENCNSFSCRCPSCAVCRIKKEETTFMKHKMENCSDSKNIKKSFILCCNSERNKELADSEKKCLSNCSSNQNNVEKITQKLLSEATDKTIRNVQINFKNSNEDCKINKNCGETSKKITASCFCKETKKYHHFHSQTCGHIKIVHNDHLDYIVDGFLHFPHDGHCDNHGKINLKEEI